MNQSILCQLCEFIIVLGPCFQGPTAPIEILPPLPPSFETGIIDTVDDPVAYRLPLENGPSDALLVALRKNENYAFDLQECRLKIAWTGPFLNLESTWNNDRPESLHLLQPLQPLGTPYFHAPETFPIRLGTTPNDPPPPPIYRGYTLVAGHPMFHYSLGQAEISELINVAPEGQGLIRLFTLETPNQPVWFYSGESPQVFQKGVRKIPEQSKWVALKPGDHGQVRFEVLLLRGAGEIRISTDLPPQ